MSFGQSICRSVGRSACRLVSMSVGRSVGQSVISMSVCRSVGRLVGWLVGWSVGHPYRSLILISVVTFFRLSLQQAKEALSVCFKVFINDTEYRALTRRAVIDKVCLILLRATSTSVIREFYVDNVKKIMEIVEVRITKVFWSFYL